GPSRRRRHARHGPDDGSGHSGSVDGPVGFGFGGSSGSHSGCCSGSDRSVDVCAARRRDRDRRDHTPRLACVERLVRGRSRPSRELKLMSRGGRRANAAEWDELLDVQDAIFDGLPIKELWSRVGSGDMKYALGLLSDFWDVDDATDVKVVAEPDDILGELIRIWVR